MIIETTGQMAVAIGYWVIAAFLVITVISKLAYDRQSRRREQREAG